MDPSASSRHRLLVSVSILVGLLVVGSLGFLIMGTEHTLFECMYLTTVILTTVGMKENSLTLSTAEQVWAMMLMLAGVSAAVYATTNLMAFMVEGEIGRLFGRRQVENKISQLRNHFLVCGFGRMGQALCEALREKHKPFVLIEEDPRQVDDALAMGYLCIRGDAMADEVLSRARLEHAAGLATCLSSDADNVFVTLTARGMSPKLTIIARAESRTSEPKLKRAGASRVICPPVLGATKIAQMLLMPGVDELMELAVAGPDIEISKVLIDELPAAVGKTIRELDMRGKTQLSIVAVVHADGSRTFTPTAELLLRAGDQVLVAGPAGKVRQLSELFGKPGN